MTFVEQTYYKLQHLHWSLWVYSTPIWLDSFHMFNERRNRPLILLLSFQVNMVDTPAYGRIKEQACWTAARDTRP